MIDERAWRELHAARFADLPFDCGRPDDPGVVYHIDLRDWSDKPTTPDQWRIEQYIDRYDLRQKRILHIGIGNSGLARRFYRRSGEIVGTTVDEPEMRVAEMVAIQNYAFVRHNKFSSQGEAIPGKFDFIIDNNPSSPCCCFSHLAVMLELYRDKLADNGQIVTDQQGLGWVPEGRHVRWGFDFDDWRAIGAAVGLSAFRASRTVYVLSRSKPKPPELRSLLGHWARQARRLPGKAAKNGPRLLDRLLRRSLKGLLLATVPWALPARYRRSEKPRR